MSFFPTPVNVPYSFESDFDGDPVGLHLNLNFLALSNTLNQVLTCLELVEREDGYIRNQSVIADSFDSSALALIAGSSSDITRWIPQGAWATATLYQPTDLVEEGSPTTSYVCVVEHVSGTFAIDHAAGKWVVLSAPRTLIGADIIAALGYTPLNKAGDTATGPIVLPTGSSFGGAPGVGMLIDTGLLATNCWITTDTGWYVSLLANANGDQSGFKSDVVSVGGVSRIKQGADFNAYAASAPANTVRGMSTSVTGLSGYGGAITGIRTDVFNSSSFSTADKIGHEIRFKNRQDDSGITAGEYAYAFPLATGAGTYSYPGEALGDNHYNTGSVALKISSQQQTASGENCGWARGIAFDEYSVDYVVGDPATTAAIPLDFSEIHYWGGTEPVAAYHMEATIAMRDLMGIWWNKTPGIANPNKVKTQFDLFKGRWTLTLATLERFGVDVNTGVIYQNGVPLVSASLSGNNTWTGTNTFANDVSIADDFAFTGVGRRIKGDFSNATPASRTLFQTATAASASEVGIIPAAGADVSGITVFSDPAVVAGNYGRMSIGTSVMLLESGRLGAAAFLPMTFGTSGSERARIATTGEVLIGTTSAPVTGGKLRVNGIIQCDNPVAFSVNRAASTFTVAHNTVTLIAFTTEAFDTGACYDTGTNRFTPPAGYYHFSGCFTLAAGSEVAEGTIVPLLYKNGSPLHNGSRVAASNGTYLNPIGASFAVTVYANGTDYFDMRAYQVNPTSTTLTVTGASVETYFSGHRVG